MPIASRNCLYLSETADICPTLLKTAGCRRLPALSRNCRHLTETVSICLICQYHLSLPVSFASICRRLATSARDCRHLPLTIGICVSMPEFVEVQPRSIGLIICAGRCQRLPAFIKDCWHSLGDCRQSSHHVCQYLPGMAASSGHRQHLLETLF